MASQSSAPVPTLASMLESADYSSMDQLVSSLFSENSRFCERLRSHAEAVKYLASSFRNSEENIDESQAAEDELISIYQQSFELEARLKAEQQLLDGVLRNVRQRNIPHQLEWKDAIAADLQRLAQSLGEENKKRIGEQVIETRRELWNERNRKWKRSDPCPADGEAEQELQVVESQEEAERIPLDPITKNEISDPVRSKQCRHLFECSVITEYLQAQTQRQNAGRIPCPYHGCKMKLHLNDLEKAVDVAMRIARIAERRKKEAEKKRRRRIQAEEQGESEDELNFGQANSQEVDLTQADKNRNGAEEEQWEDEEEVDEPPKRIKAEKK
jgi:hypothetical protein